MRDLQFCFGLHKLSQGLLHAKSSFFENRAFKKSAFLVANLAFAILLIITYFTSLLKLEVYNFVSLNNAYSVFRFKRLFSHILRLPFAPSTIYLLAASFLTLFITELFNTLKLVYNQVNDGVKMSNFSLLNKTLD